MNKKLMAIPGFLSFLLIVFINAFVDLGHKIIIQNTVFKSFDGGEQIVLTGIVNALILLPFIFLFSISGFVSNRYDKTKVMKYSALFAVATTLMITFCYYNGFFWGAFGLTLVLAIQSAIYSPAKFGYIKEIVGIDNLSTANGAVQAISTIAILSGIGVFSVFFENMISSSISPSVLISEIKYLGWVLVGLSLVEAIIAFKLPSFNKGNDKKSFNVKKFAKMEYLKANIKSIYSDKIIWLSIIGLSIFFSISQVMLSVFPSYAKEVLKQESVMAVQGILALAGIGIMAGSYVSSKLSKGYIETGLIPIGAFGVAFSVLMISYVENLYGLSFMFFGMGFFGALFIIPLNSLIQFYAPKDDMGTVLAGNNFIQTVFMTLFLSATIFAAYFGVSGSYLIYAMSVVAVFGAVYTVIKIPQSLVRFIVTGLFSQRYRLKVNGFGNLPAEGGVLMLGNHTSWIDWAIVQMASPRQVHFVMAKEIYNKKFIKIFCDFFGVIPISSGSSKNALSTVTEYLKEGKVVCLFPEGAISRNGQLGEFKRGFELAAKDSGAVILPFYLRGLWGSKLSRSKEKLRSNRKLPGKRNVIVAFGKTMKAESTASEVKQQVFELSFSSWEEYTYSMSPIHNTWIKKAKSLKGLSVADYATDTEISHSQLIVAVRLFAKRIKKISRKESNIGIILPASSASMITNMAVLSLGKTVVNVNYTTSIESLDKSMNKAEVESIYTSEKFVRKLKGRGINIESLFEGRKVIFLEDFKKEIKTKEKVWTMLMVKALPSFILEELFCKNVDINSPAAILFSSGSEGEPKGVVLSHRNIVANATQIADVINGDEKDVILNSLPTFHAFGLTVTSIMPMIEGVPTVCYPDPTDSVNIGKAVAKYNATLICATSTFLRLYAKNRKLIPEMFDSIRFVVGGAEKISDDVRSLFESKFKRTIYEGYGATETTPVASVNLPDIIDKKYWTVQKGSKSNSVGMPIPGTAFKVVDPETMKEMMTGEDGLILIGGCQIMLGYLNDEEKTNSVITTINGMRWYKTGDKGHLDKDGFLTIVDRYSRFAKIGGEMISLGAVEQEIKKHIDIEVANVIAVNIPDEKKGEKVVLLVSGDIEIEEIKDRLSKSETPAIMKPSSFHKVDSLPILGTGKVDFKGANLLAISLE